MSKNFTELTKCNLCENFLDFKPILRLGNMSINIFPTKDIIEKEEFSHDILECQNCGHIQFSGKINSELIDNNPLYNTSNNSSYFQKFCGAIAGKIKLSYTD